MGIQGTLAVFLYFRKICNTSLHDGKVDCFIFVNEQSMIVYLFMNNLRRYLAVIKTQQSKRTLKLSGATQ